MFCSGVVPDKVYTGLPEVGVGVGVKNYPKGLLQILEPHAVHTTFRLLDSIFLVLPGYMFSLQVLHRRLELVYSDGGTLSQRALPTNQ